MTGTSSLARNARVVRALGMRSVRQTFRRPQLIAPIIVFPTLLLAIQTGGAQAAVNLPGFPEVQSFLQFMLAGASAVQVGTANFVDPCAAKHVLDGLKAHCESRGVDAQALVGSAR